MPERLSKCADQYLRAYALVWVCGRKSSTSFVHRQPGGMYLWPVRVRQAPRCSWALLLPRDRKRGRGCPSFGTEASWAWQSAETLGWRSAGEPCITQGLPLWQACLRVTDVGSTDSWPPGISLSQLLLQPGVAALAIILKTTLQPLSISDSAPPHPPPAPQSRHNSTHFPFSCALGLEKGAQPHETVAPTTEATKKQA